MTTTAASFITVVAFMLGIFVGLGVMSGGSDQAYADARAVCAMKGLLVGFDPDKGGWFCRDPAVDSR